MNTATFVLSNQIAYEDYKVVMTALGELEPIMMQKPTKIYAGVENPDG